MEPKKVAICFFGLTRSLKTTLPSIQSSIFNVLNNQQIPYDIYCHTYDLKKIKLKRSKENSDLNPDEYKSLHPDYERVDSQEEFLKQYPCQKIFKFGDPWKTKFENSKNLLCQLNSLNQVTKMWLKNKEKYFGCIYLRPDLEYKNIFPICQLLAIQKYPKQHCLFLPQWDKYEGCNDRIAMATLSAAEHYGTRLVTALQYCRNNKKPLQAEKFLKWHIKQNKEIIIKTFLLVGIRVRANQKRHRPDVIKLKFLYQKYNRQNKINNRKRLRKLKEILKRNAIKKPCTAISTTTNVPDGTENKEA